MKKILINSLAKSGTNYVIEILRDIGYIEGAAGFSYQSVLSKPIFLRKLIRGGLFEKAPLVVGLDIQVAMGEGWVRRKLSRLSEGQFTSSHLNYSDRLSAILKELNIATIQVIRDPLAVALSYKEYLEKSEAHLCHKSFVALSDNQKWEIVVNGGKLGSLYVESLRQRLLAVSEWSRHPGNVFLIKYEDLISARADSNDSFIAAFAEFIDCRKDDVLSSVKNTYGNSKTFNRGDDPRYRDRIPEVYLKQIKSEVSDIALSWGYWQ